MIKVNSEKELINLDMVIWRDDNKIMINRYGVFHLEDNIYPKYFKYVEPYDTHFCGDYWECTYEGYEHWINSRIKYYENEIAKLKATLNK